jgi:peptidyl-prolyl cis-trans isomerase C
MATIVVDHRALAAEQVQAKSPKAGTRPTARPEPARPQIAVDGVVIPHAAIAREVQNHPAENPAEAWTEAARALIVRELLVQEARRLAIEAEPLEDEEGRRETDEEALIRVLMEREISLPEPDDASTQRYYEKNLRLFRSADLFEAAHILFSADWSDKDAFAAAVESAKSAIALLTEEPSRFPDLARELSACSSSSEGGHLGQFTRDQVTPEFSAALDQLRSGEISVAPVETPYGVHVIRLDRRVNGQTLPFEAVRKRIASHLKSSVWRHAAAQYISLLSGRATITGFDFGGAETPLVQ